MYSIIIILALCLSGCSKFLERIQLTKHTTIPTPTPLPSPLPTYGLLKRIPVTGINFPTGLPEANVALPSGFPMKLSQTGLFEDVASLMIKEGIIPYNVNVPLWSDGAEKARWILLPGDSKITFNETSPWVFPIGTILLKEFDMQMSDGIYRRLELRVLIHDRNGWRGYTYKWNADETDADLVAATGESEMLSTTDEAGVTKVVNWKYPGRSTCFECHQSYVGTVLGVNTRQINANYYYPEIEDNQIRAWNYIDLFSVKLKEDAPHDSYPDYTDATLPLQNRARAYLAVNCSHCHNGNPANLDQNPQSFPNFSYNQPNPTRTIGDKILYRMSATSSRMPNIGTEIPDANAVSLIRDWISNLQ